MSAPRFAGRAAAAAAAAALALAAPAAAQVRVWTGAVANNDWNTAGNWNPAGVPNSAGQSVVFGNAGFGTVNISGNVQAGTITFDTGGAGDFNLTSSAGRTLSGVTNITVAPGVTGTQTINLANIVTGSLLFPSGQSLAIANDAAATAVASPTLVIGPNTVIGTPGTGGVTVGGVGTTLFSGSFASSVAPNNLVDGGLTKTGAGTLTLAGNNTNLAGGAAVGSASLVAAGGLLRLDYAASNTNKIGSGALGLAGGDLTLLAHPSAAATQTAAGGTVLLGGHSAVLLDTNAGAFTAGLTLNLNAITRNAGGTADITAQPFSAATTTTGLTSGILGSYATVNGGATWATKTGSTIVGLTAFGSNTFTSGTNTDVTANVSFAGGFTTNSLRFNTVVAGGLSVTNTGAGVVQSGGILLTPTSGGVTFTSGSLGPTPGGELIIHQYSPATAGLTIDSDILASGLTKTGPGLLTLGGVASNITGPVSIHRGNLRITRTTAVNGSTGLFFNDTRSGNALQTFTAQFGDGFTTPVFQNVRFSATSTPGNYANVLSTGTNENARVTLAGVVSSAPGAGTPIRITGASSDTSGFNLTGDNTFRGDVRVDQGILGIDADASLGDPANKLSMASTLVGGLEFLNGGVNVARPVELSGQVRINTLNDDVNTISGVISGTTGTAAPLKDGPGTLVLTGANTFTGGTHVSEGTLRISAPTNLGTGASSVWVHDGATLAATETFSLGRGLQVGPESGSGTGTVEVAAGRTLTISSIVANRLSGTGALRKTGPGTLALTHVGNLYGGGTTVEQGTLRVSADGSLGVLGRPVRVEPLGTLAFAGSGPVQTARTITLDGGTLAVPTGSLQLVNATILGSGAITGPGPISTQFGTTNAFAGGSTTTLANLALSGTDTFVNFSNGGQLQVNPSVSTTFTRVTNTSSGRMTILGSATTSEFVSNGALSINNGATLTNAAASLVLGGGSATFVGNPATSGGTIDLGGQELQLRGGLLVNNGAVINGATVVDFGGLAKGAGTFDSVTTINGGRFSPGNSPGRATVGTFFMSPGGQYDFEINNATGTAGPTGTSGLSGWDLTLVGNTLDVTATPSQHFTINLVSLLDPSPPDVSGAMANFNPGQPYSWLAFDVTTGGQILGWNPSNITLNPVGVLNPLNGNFEVRRDGSQVFIDYEPLIRTLYWDANGPGLPGAGGATPAGNWNGATPNFNTDPTGGAAGTTTALTTATDTVVFAAGADGGGSYTVSLTGTQAAAEVQVARGDVTLAGGTLAAAAVHVAAGASGTLTSALAGGPAGTLTKTGPGPLTLAAANPYAGGTTAAAGTLVAGDADALGTGPLAVAGGATARVQAGLPRALSLPAPLGITAAGPAGGTLDLTDNALVIRHADPAAAFAGHAALNALARNAFNEFAWNQPGITSSTVAADIAAGIPSAVGVLLNNDGGGNALFYGDGTALPQFEGRSVDGNAVLTKYTLLGDGDLNGTVDSVDFALFQAGYTGAAPYIGFAFGDYDYNGVIDSVDFGLFQAGYQHSQSNPTPEMIAFAAEHHLSLIAAAVPEPTTFGLLALAGGGMVLLRRERHRRTS